MSRRTVVRICLIAIPAAALVFMVWIDLAPRGIWHVVSDPTRYQSNISFFYPEGRLTSPVWGPDGWQQNVVSEPLYVNVRMPRQLARVRARLWYQAVSDTGLRLGLRVGEGGVWQYNLQPLVIVGEDNGWQVREVEFDLSQAAVEKQYIRFILSAPRLNQPSSLIIHRLAVTASGDPLTFFKVKQKILHLIAPNTLPAL